MSVRSSRSLLICLCLCSLLAVTCGGGSPSNPSTGASGGTSGSSVTASIDGVPYASASVTAGVENGFLAVGSVNASHSVSLGVGAPAAIGTYFMANGPAIASVGKLATREDPVSAEWAANDLQGSGSITITAIAAHNAKGTFNFIAVPGFPGVTGARLVTNGVFDVSF